MKVLEISFLPPDKMSGGGMGIYQSIKSLLGIADVDYIGPQYNSTLFADATHTLNNLCILKAGKRSFGRYILKKVSTLFYDDWKEFVGNIKWSNYDLVHIESSRYFFAVNEAKKHKVKVVIRMHNIESDYGLNLYRKHRSASNYLRYRSYYSNEKKSVCKADALIFLTESDILRARKLYNVSPDISFKNPVCIDVNNDEASKNNFEFPIRFLMTGTLNYGSNVDGIIWFLENVWNKHYRDGNHALTIAGANPNDRLKKVISKIKNVCLVDTPEDMRPYFDSAYAYIAPIFDGAGMKVKVAEAFSHGLPVIGTTHAFIGYENVENGKFVADTSQEFVEQINKLHDLRFQVCRTDVFNEFCQKLSITASVTFYKNLLKIINGENK